MYVYMIHFWTQKFTGTLYGLECIAGYKYKEKINLFVPLLQISVFRKSRDYI